MTDIKRLMVYCPHGHDLEEDDFPDVGRYVLFADHAAAVARLESRLSLAEKVVEAAEVKLRGGELLAKAIEWWLEHGRHSDQCVSWCSCGMQHARDQLAAYRSAK